MRFRDLKKQKNKKQKQDKPKFIYASTPDRIKAFITDMFMIYVPILYILAYIVLDGKEAFQASSGAQFIGVALYGIIYAAFVGTTGQTPGKKAYTIKVVDVNTLKKISYLRAFLRFVAFLFSATIALGLLMQFIRKDNRTLHDLLLKTVVIKDKE
jgi:uncharacterized RDD family membrane protein YckC